MSNLISNTNNINIDGMSEPAVKLLDKLSTIIDWNMSSMGAHRLAQEDFIGFIRSSDDIPEALKPALVYNSKKILKEFSNQQDVIAYGVKLLNDIVYVDEIDDEWLYEFMDGAGRATSDELKMIWGKILASECNEKNSIPKRLLFILKQMDSDVALAFSRLCSTCIHYENDEGGVEYQPIVVDYKSRDDCPVTYNDIIELSALGLIEYNDSLTGPYTICELDDKSEINYFDKTYYNLVNNGVFVLGLVLFTRAGESLAKNIEVEPIPDYIENCYLPFLNHLQKMKKELKDIDSHLSTRTR